MKLIRINMGYFLLLPVIVGGIGALFLPSIRASLDKASDSEAKVTISSVEKALSAYFEEFNQYSDDFEKIGLPVRASQISPAYLNMKQVPGELAERLRKSEHPFVNEISYRILVVMKNGDRIKIYIKEKNSDSVVRRLL